MDLRHRKMQLIQRDPLGREFEDIFQKWLIDKQNFELWDKLIKIKNKIKEKYRCVIAIFEELGKWAVADRLDSAVQVGQQPWWLPNDKKNNLIHCEPHVIPILIDPTLITLNDARRVKKEVWKIVEHELKQRPAFTRPPCGFPADAPPELAKLLRCNGKTFEKYIRWYDLKMRGLTFRMIARIEHSFKETKEKEVTYQRELARNKKTPITGGRVKGESTVRRGFDLVYVSIHREKPPQKETDIPTQDKYNCPDHGTGCPRSCPTLIKFKQEFDRRHPDKPLREKLVRDLEYIK